jgi:hypothetical protein
MKYLALATTIPASIALLFGCVAPLPLNYGLSPIPVDGRLKDRIQFAGVSFLAPRGEDWIALPLACSEPPVAQHYASFGKAKPEGPGSTSRATHTVAAQVMALDVGDRKFRDTTEFKRYWDARAQVGVQTSPRHRLMASAVTIDGTLGSMCVKYRLEIEDTGAPAFPGSVLTLDVTGYRCLHPLSPRYAVDIAYSQRYPKGELPVAMENEVDPFLKSLRMETYLNPGPLFCRDMNSSEGSSIRFR